MVRAMTRRFQSQHLLELEPGRAQAKPKLRLCGEPAEADVLRQVIAALTAMPEVAFVARINSGAFTREDAKGKEQYYSFCTIMSSIAVDFLSRHITDYSTLASAKLKMPDVIGMLKTGVLFAFEVKKRGKKAQPGQVAFLDLVRANGGIGIVVYSAKEAMDVLKNVKGLSCL